MDCVINNLTGRAVKVDSLAGRKALKYNAKNKIESSHECVINPATGRAVKKTGALGKKIVNSSSTINQAVKMKIARKTVEKAKVEAKPKTPPPTPKPTPKPAQFIPYKKSNETEKEWLERLFKEAMKIPKDDRMRWFMNLPNTSLPQAFTYIKLLEKRIGKKIWDAD